MNTEFNEADMTLALEAAGYTTYGPAEEKACKLAQIVLAASRKKLMEQEPVGVTDMAGGIHWKRGAPIQAKLYTAPMPHANESEAVKALRELVRTWETHEEGKALLAARAVLAGEPGAKATLCDDEGCPHHGIPHVCISRIEQPKQAQAMYERELFHAWFGTYADPHSGRVERNIKRKAAWDAWQSRAALAQTQGSGNTEKYCDDHCTWLDHDPECVIGGKAAPSIDRNAIIEECAHALEKFSLGKNSYEQGINEGFRLAAEKLRGMIKNC